MRRRIGIALLAIAGVVGAGWGAWRYTGLGGSSAVEDWVRQYLVTVLQRHLNPDIHIGDLDYEYPRTVSITDFRLNQSGVDILAVNHIRLELAEIPRTGEPILIEQVDLAGPAFRVEKGAGGEITGWSNLLRGRAGAVEPRVEKGFQVSDFMRLRIARIRNGSFTYRSGAEKPETILGGVHVELETPAASDGPGWYQLIGTLTRDELAKLSLDGRINVDSGDVVMNALKLEGMLDEARYSIFPQSVQAMLRQLQLQGSLTLEASGAWSPRDASRTEVHAQARLANTRFVHQGVVLTSAGVDIRGDFAGNALDINASGDVLDGNATLHLTATIEENETGNLSVDVSKVNLAQLIRLAPRNLGDVLDPLQPDGRITGEFKGKLAANWALSSADIKAAVEPATIQILQRPLESAKITLSAALESGASKIEISADELRNNARPLGREVQVRIHSNAGRTDVSTGLAVFGGRADGVVQIAADQSGKYPFSIRTSGIRLEELQSVIHGNSVHPALGGIVGGDLAGTWDRTDWTASDGAGTLSISNGRLNLQSVTLPMSTNGLKLKLNNRRMEVDGNVNVCSGSFAGRIGWDVPGINKVDVIGQVQSVSLAALLDATRQTWNKLPGGGTRMDGRFTGDVSVAVPAVASEGISGELKLRGGTCHCYVGESRVPIDSCDIVADLGNKRVAARANLALLGGRAELNGNLPLDSHGEWSLGWLVRGIQIEGLSRLRSGSSRHPYRGVLAGEGNLKGRLPDMLSALAGRGRLEITQGHLLELPIVHEITKLLKPAAQLIGSAAEDKARATFIVKSQGVESDSFEVESPMMAIRGRGKVKFDGGLDLAVRATAAPQITRLLGPLDRLIDDASGRLVTYRVSGTVERPVVRVEPLGLSVFPGD